MPCGQERLGDREADPARGAGHDRRTALQLCQPRHRALLHVGMGGHCDEYRSDPQVGNDHVGPVVVGSGMAANGPSDEAHDDRALCADLRVVVVGESIAATVAGMVMADFGAEVTVVEPPGGTRLRAAPAYGDVVRAAPRRPPST